MFPQASSDPLHPYLQCEHSAALVAKVSPLATVSSLHIVCAAWWYFIVWLAEHWVAGMFGIVFSFPCLPLYILVVGGCYSLACLQSYWLILFASCLFIPLFQWFSLLLLLLLLLLFYFSLFWSVSTEYLSVWLVPTFVLSYFVLFISSLGWGLMAGLWILLALGVVPFCRGWVAGQL